jgi:hypothetical protein
VLVLCYSIEDNCVKENVKWESALIAYRISQCSRQCVITAITGPVSGKEFY